MLILAISKYLDELLEDGRLAAAAALSKLGRVVVMAIHMAIVFIVAVRRAEHCWA